MRTLLAWALCVLLATPAAAFDDALPESVAAALAQAGLPAEAFAAIAVPRTFWARTWQYRADVPMQPGSTMKLVTTAVALDRLGPNLRGRTELLAAGPIAAGVLDGDLVLKGGADPDFDLPALWQLLLTLRQQGVREIAGEQVLDRTLFRPPRLVLGAAPVDDAPQAPYNVVPDALMVDGHLLRIAVDSDGTSARAQALPALDGVDIDASALALVDAPCADRGEGWQAPQASPREPGRWRVALAGTFPRHCSVQARGQWLDRTLLTERLVRAVWTSLGGTWRQPPGAVREAATPPGSTRIALHEARPWAEVLRQANKASDNPPTRLLFLQLGVAAMARDPDVTTLALARREVERWFDDQRIARDGLVLDNGSGLSRSERIAPRTLARVIAAALDGAHAPDWLASLPLAGVDGTMRRRLKGTRADGWARLKTGTLSNVRALAGTVRDTRGDDWVVVAMINHDDAHKGRAALDAWIEWIADSGARWR